MNGTYRELEARILAYRARTGADYDRVWISPERWRLLPDDFRGTYRADFVGTISGVPIGVMMILAPDDSAHERRQQAWEAAKGPQGGWGKPFRGTYRPLG